MVRYLMYFSYIGTRYRGIQKQPTHPGETVQDLLEIALRTLHPKNNPVARTCSRTDKGVHALMNAVHVDLEHGIPGETYQPHVITDRVNEFLKNDDHSIIVTKTCVVPNHFHARKYARWRSYIYRIALLKPYLKEFSYKSVGYDAFMPICERNRSYIIHGSVDCDCINEAAKYFVGTHDFTTFGKYILREKKSPIKTVQELKFQPCQVPPNILFDPMYNNIDLWEFRIKADSYLYHQVRKIVGTLISVGYGFLSMDDVRLMLERPSSFAWRHSLLPPAGGLYLSEISFDKRGFQWREEEEEKNEEEEQESEEEESESMCR